MNRNTIIVIVSALAAAAVVFVAMKKPPPDPGPTTTTPSTIVETSTGNAAVVATVTAPTPPVAFTIDPAQVKPIPNATLDMATVALEAKMITNAQQLLADGKPRDALKQIEEYEHVPDRAALVPEGKFLKIEALARMGGHKTDALAFAMSARNDPDMSTYLPRIDAELVDAGVTAPTSASP